jgi:diguanylate cyclase (GGDEF)-like protein
MLSTFRLETTLGVLLLVTILAIVGEKRILQSFLRITPASGYDIKVFDDAKNGGNSHAELIDPAHFEWRCTLRDKYLYNYCSFEIFFDPQREHGIDLRNFNKIRIWLDYEGPSKTVRIYLRNFDPLYSNINDEPSTKYNQIEFSTDQLKNHFAEFSLEDFFVSNWWMYQYKIPPQLSHPQFDNIVIFEVQTGTQDSLGDHHFKLHHVELIGQRITTEQWYKVIMLTWLAIFVIFLGYRIIALNKQVRLQKKRETELLEINALLDVRSKQLDEKSKTDSLTGAFNREGIEETIRLGLSEWRTQKKPLSLIMIDIDHFKHINDHYGHAMGDYVLSNLTKLVKSHIRDNDLFARWGGEEFVLVCRDTKIDKAGMIAEKIRLMIADNDFDNRLHITASFGVATLNANETLEQLFGNADKALYRAKHEGRNKIIISENH